MQCNSGRRPASHPHMARYRLDNADTYRFAESNPGEKVGVSCVVHPEPCPDRLEYHRTSPTCATHDDVQRRHRTIEKHNVLQHTTTKRNVVCGVKSAIWAYRQRVKASGARFVVRKFVTCRAGTAHNQSALAASVKSLGSVLQNF